MWQRNDREQGFRDVQHLLTVEYAITFAAGLLVGMIIVLLINYFRAWDAKRIAREALSQTESRHTDDLEAIIGNLKDSFGSLSLEALSRNTGEFLKLANEALAKQAHAGEKELEGKKQLIDQTLAAMKEDLGSIETLVGNLERDREQKFGELTHQLKSTAEETVRLRETTGKLHEALSSTKARGQWGERMAEDVLRLAGFIEGVNYRRQKTLETVNSRPDYTFLLPQDLIVNMDVKFPLDNYLRYLEARGSADRERYKKQFLRDVKHRIGEVVTRDYINPEENTVDYVIVFIPNEQVYAFINEHDSSILDEALKNKVILSSPITLYAILAVIRQAVDNFNLEKTAAQIMSLLATFNKQWDFFVNSFDKMGRKIDEVQREYNHLTSTRRNQLERPLRQIANLRRQQGFSEDRTDAIIIDRAPDEGESQS